MSTTLTVRYHDDERDSAQAIATYRISLRHTLDDSVSGMTGHQYDGKETRHTARASACVDDQVASYYQLGMPFAAAPPMLLRMNTSLHHSQL